MKRGIADGTWRNFARCKGTKDRGESIQKMGDGFTQSRPAEYNEVRRHGDRMQDMGHQHHTTWQGGSHRSGMFVLKEGMREDETDAMVMGN